MLSLVLQTKTHFLSLTPQKSILAHDIRSGNSSSFFFLFAKQSLCKVRRIPFWWNSMVHPKSQIFTECRVALPTTQVITKSYDLTISQKLFRSHIFFGFEIVEFLQAKRKFFENFRRNVEYFSIYIWNEIEFIFSKSKATKKLFNHGHWHRRRTQSRKEIGKFAASKKLRK